MASMGLGGGQPTDVEKLMLEFELLVFSLLLRISPLRPGKSRGVYDHILFNQRYLARRFARSYGQANRMEFVEYSKLKMDSRGWTHDKALQDSICFFTWRMVKC